MAGYNNKQYKQTPSAAEKYKNPEFGTIKTTVQKGKTDLITKLKYSILNLYNVDPQSAKEIVARLTDTTKKRTTLKAWIDKNEPTHVCVSIPEKLIGQWLDGGELNAIQSVLLKSGKYDTDEIMQLEDNIFIGFDSQNVEKANKLGIESQENSLQMWQRYLSKINDPVEKKQIELYSRVFRNAKYIDENGVERNLGNILSLKNAALIRSKYPDATFVASQGIWRAYFNRGVKRNATPIPYYAPNVEDRGSAKSFSASQQKFGWGDYKKTDIPVQAKRNIEMDSQEKGEGYRFVIGYDVKDTFLLSGAKDDVFNTQEGYLNNLIGELNGVAKSKFKANEVNPETIDGNDEMMKRTEKACLWAETALPQQGYKISSTYSDASNKLADYVLEYCKVNATKKANVLSENNINTYAQNATQVTLILTNLAMNALSRFNSKYDYTKDEAKALMSIVWGIATNLEKNAVITESIMSWIKDKAQFIKMFFKALRQIGCTIKKDNVNPIEQPTNNITKEDVKNNFYEVFDRINKNHFYDDNRI